MVEQGSRDTVVLHAPRKEIGLKSRGGELGTASSVRL
jgi:hypothetical protein